RATEVGNQVPWRNVPGTPVSLKSKAPRHALGRISFHQLLTTGRDSRTLGSEGRTHDI
ncbi:hypothetical protein LEMLEM_LOCUS10686, partial [Lemmus lemmus]